MPSAAFMILAGLWCVTRRRFLVYSLPVAVLVALYAKIHGAPHHHGTVFVAAITAFWIAWPEAKEERAFTPRQRQLHWGMIALLLCLCGLNIWDAVVTIQREYLYPYSGSWTRQDT